MTMMNLQPTLVKQLDARIRSHWGEWRNVQLFTVDSGVDGLRFPAIEVVGDEDGTEIVLGRNFLNIVIDF